MKKLIKGILEFRSQLTPEYREVFAKLALGQSPDALLIACSDSRVVPNLFASADPGDLFVLRNVGNLVPPCACHGGEATNTESEAAALDFALQKLNVDDIIICGHSECGAVQALLQGRDTLGSHPLKSWLKHGDESQRLPSCDFVFDDKLSLFNKASQKNVLNQIANLKTYPLVRERIAAGKLFLHAWWFDIATADLYNFDESQKRFVLFDDAQAKRIVERLAKADLEPPLLPSKK